MHIESNSRLCMASAGTGFKQSLGADGPPGSYTDFDCTDLFFVIGSNMADCHPILYLRMADRLKAGAKLIVVDPRRTATAERADLFLQIKPGTDLALLNGLLHLLVENGDIDAEFIAGHTDGWDAMAEFLADYPPHRVAEITGLAESDIRTAARMIAEAGELDELLDDGAQPEHARHLEHQCDLQPAPGHRGDLPTGQRADVADRPAQRDGRPRNGLHGAGSARVSASVLSADDRAFVEDAVGAARRAPSVRTSVRAPSTCSSRWRDGRIKACWIICTNPVATVANRKTVITGLETAELVITQDAYRTTATNRYADIVLPATLWAESDAVMVNSERNLTLLQQSIPAAGQARPDWQLICQVAAHMGFGEHFAYQSSEEIFDEIRRFCQSEDRLRPARCQLRAVAADAAAVARVRRMMTDRAPDPLPQRRCQPGAVRRRERPHAAAGVPDSVAARGVPRPAAHGCSRTARRRYPAGAEHRSAATPMAHDDQDRQGRQAQQARQRPVRRDSPRRRRRARHRRAANPSS